MGDGQPPFAFRIHGQAEPEMPDGFHADAPGFGHIGEGIGVKQEPFMGSKDQTGLDRSLGWRLWEGLADAVSRIFRLRQNTLPFPVIGAMA